MDDDGAPIHDKRRTCSGTLARDDCRIVSSRLSWSWFRCPGPWTAAWKPSEYGGCPYRLPHSDSPDFLSHFPPPRAPPPRLSRPHQPRPPCESSFPPPSSSSARSFALFLRLSLPFVFVFRLCPSFGSRATLSTLSAPAVTLPSRFHPPSILARTLRPLCLSPSRIFPSPPQIRLILVPLIDVFPSVDLSPGASGEFLNPNLVPVSQCSPDNVLADASRKNRALRLS